MEQGIPAHEGRLGIGVVERRGAFHQVAVGGDVSQVLEHRFDFRSGHRTLLVVHQRFRGVETRGTGDRRKHQVLEITGVNTLVGEQGAVGIDRSHPVAQGEKLTPGFRQREIVGLEIGGVIDHTQPGVEERRDVHPAVVVGGCALGLQKTVEESTLQGVTIQHIGDLFKPVFLEQRLDDTRLVAPVQNHDIRRLSGDHLGAQNLGDLRRSGDVHLDPGALLVYLGDRVLPGPAVAAFEHVEIDFPAFLFGALIGAAGKSGGREHYAIHDRRDALHHFAHRLSPLRNCFIIIHPIVSLSIII